MGDKIISFIQKEGYMVFPQIPLFLGKIDFVGINRNSECLVVESKVKKWKKALKQALRYGSGAEKAYVALPAPTARNVERKHRKVFENYEIGLMEVSGEVNIIIPCETKMPFSIFKEIILREVQEREVRSHERISRFKERYK